MSASPSPPGTAVPEPVPQSDSVKAEAERVFKKLFARGSTWALINYAVGYTLRLGSNFVLWRLLYPDAFGLMAIVNVFIQGLAMFSDIGIGQSVIQHKQGEDPKFLNTVWTLQVVRGLTICALASAAAIPLSRFYHQPELGKLIPAVALGVGVSAFNSTKLFVANRRLALGRLAMIDIVSQCGSMVVMVVWSYLTHSVWGLAVGSLVSPLIRLVLSFKALPGANNRFGWDRETVKAVSHFGRWIMLSTILTFMASYSDRLIFGKLVSIDRLGVYSIALVWATFPTYIIGHLANTVLFPLFSRVNTQGGSVPESFAKVRSPLLFAGAWLFACLVAGGPTLIRFLYDHRAAEAGVFVPLLAVGSWVSSVESTNSYALLSLGKPKWLAFGNAAKLVSMLVLLPIGARWFGFSAAVLALSLSEIARYAVSAQACIRFGLRPVRQDFRFSIGIGLTAALGLLVRAGYRQLHLPIFNSHLDAFVEGALIFLAVTAPWLGSYALARRRGIAI